PGANPSVWGPTNIAPISGSGQLLNQAYNYVNGNSTQQAAALAFMDNDGRLGPLAPISMTSNCPNAVATFTLPMPNNTYSFAFAFSQKIYLTSTGTLPTGFLPNTEYEVIDVGSNTFQ